MRHYWLVTLIACSLAACGAGDDNKNNNTQSLSGVSSPSCSVAGITEDGADMAAALAVRDGADRHAPHTRFIVKMSRPEAAEAAVTDGSLARAADGATTERLSDDTVLMQLPEATSAAELSEKLGREGFEYVEPDELVTYALASNDTSLAKQWAHDMVKSAQAWDISRGSAGVTVAILDSGVDYNHPDLRANMWQNPREISGNGLDDDGNGYVDDVYGWNFVSNNNRPLADDGSTYHGTHVAGTVGAVGNNGLGISGHAQTVKLMALKFLNSSGSGFRSDAIRGIDYAIRNGAKIINNSWGGTTYSQALSDAIGRARAAGVLFVAAAGNNGSNNDRSSFYPANYPHDNVVSVASSTSADKLSSFSNYGVTKVHLAAPGSAIYSTKNGNAYQYLSGTSMATPLVSGVLATMVAIRPDLSYRQIKGALLRNVDVKATYTGKVISNGRINSFRALSSIAEAPASQIPDTGGDCL